MKAAHIEHTTGQSVEAWTVLLHSLVKHVCLVHVPTHIVLLVSAAARAGNTTELMRLVNQIL